MNTRLLGPLVVAAAVILAGSSARPALADNTAATYHQIALISIPGSPLTSFDISFVERSSQTYYLADRSNKAVDIINAASNTFDTGGAVAVIDPRTHSRVGLFAVQNCEPAGLALGPNQHLLLGCGDPTAVQVMDARTGAVVATISQVSGADEVWYNPGDKHYYVAARNNPTGPVLGIIDAMTDTWIQNVPTGVGAHSVAAHPINDEIFVPLRPTATHLLGGIGVYHQVSR